MEKLTEVRGVGGRIGPPRGTLGSLDIDIHRYSYIQFAKVVPTRRSRPLRGGAAGSISKLPEIPPGGSSLPPTPRDLRPSFSISIRFFRMILRHRFWYRILSFWGRLGVPSWGHFGHFWWSSCVSKFVLTKLYV